MQELTLDTDNRTKEKHKGKGRKKRYKQQGRTPDNPNPTKYLSQYSRRLITFRETQKEGSNITRTKNNSRPPAKPPYFIRPITFRQPQHIRKPGSRKRYSLGRYYL